MQTVISDLILSHYSAVYKRAKQNLQSIEKIASGELTIDDVNSKIFFTIGGMPPKFSLMNFETEVRSNILKIENDNSLLQYFYYLIKIHHKLKRQAIGIDRYTQSISDLMGAERTRTLDLGKDKYSSIDELIFHCHLELLEVKLAPFRIYMILKDEFGFKVKDWKENIVNKLEMPSFFEIRNMFSGPVDEGQDNEVPPKYNYKTEAQKIAWLHELGVLKTILANCKEGESYNWRRAANIINSFTGINLDTVRKSLQAIYQPNEGNKKNNPLTNPENKLFVADMIAKFKLDKEG